MQPPRSCAYWHTRAHSLARLPKAPALKRTSLALPEAGLMVASHRGQTCAELSKLLVGSWFSLVMAVSILQLSDPHLLANPLGWYRGVQPFVALKNGLESALVQIGRPPNLLLLTGDLCQDESWAGYALLRNLLVPLGIPIALLAGNHDHPQLLRACLGRVAHVAPALIPIGGWQLLLLDSHWPGEVDGWISKAQLHWAKKVLNNQYADLLVAVHHPPEAQREGSLFLDRLATFAKPKIVLMGHIHQHRRDTHAKTTLLGCPSSFLQFKPTQICPLGLPHQCGARFVELEADGTWQETLLRWPN